MVHMISPSKINVGANKGPFRVTTSSVFLPFRSNLPRPYQFSTLTMTNIAEYIALTDSVVLLCRRVALSMISI